MTDHALMLVGRIAAQGPSPTVSQPPHWLSVAQATGAVATTIGVLIALYIAAIREPRKDAADRRHHAAQIDALHRAEKERCSPSSKSGALVRQNADVRRFVVDGQNRQRKQCNDHTACGRGYSIRHQRF
jgi:hypothetical protein